MYFQESFETTAPPQCTYLSKNQVFFSSKFPLHFSHIECCPSPFNCSAYVEREMHNHILFTIVLILRKLRAACINTHINHLNFVYSMRRQISNLLKLLHQAPVKQNKTLIKFKKNAKSCRDCEISIVPGNELALFCLKKFLLNDKSEFVRVHSAYRYTCLFAHAYGCSAFDYYCFAVFICVDQPQLLRTQQMWSGLQRN